MSANPDTLTQLETLRDRVEAFAQLRDREAKVKKALQQAEERFRREHMDLIREQAETSLLRAQLEQVIRDEARMEFLATGDKNPAPGVSIRQNTRLEYDPAKALKFAMDTHTCVLLDRKAFEKLAGETPLDFVETVTDPTVCISSSLFAAFEEARR